MRILAYIFFSYLTLSVIGFIILVFRKEVAPSPERRPIYYFPIMIGFLFSLFYVLFQGFKEFLVLIPYSWGSYNDEGEWGSYRDGVAITLSIATISYLFYLIGEIDRKEKVIQKLKNQRTNILHHKDSP